MAPLDGIRVIDLSRVVAGPFCTMLLGDMGADVIKIEEPRRGDDTREWAPIVNGWSTYFLGLNRNKKSVALDLKTVDGADALRALLADADVMIENFRPGSLAKLGFGFDQVSRLNPRIVYCSISGYGQTGPRSQLPGYDVVIQGESGLMSVTGQPDGGPTRVGIAIADHLAGLYAHQGILLALLERARSGVGQYIDIALLDSMVSVLTLPMGILQATGTGPARMGNAHPSIAPYETFAVRGGFMIVAAGNPRLWRQLCAAIDRNDLADDPRFRESADRLRHREALKRELELVFHTFPAEKLLARLQAHQVPCGRIRDIAEVLQDPELAARRMVVRVPDAPAELGALDLLGNPVHLSRAPWSVRLPPPRLGEHTEEILNALTHAASRQAHEARPHDGPSPR
jgi:crotonobetainyl-CoA:carnitine CoA-transferase CaiB-like acyl-CoA transferase